MASKSSITFTSDGAWCWFQDPWAVRHAGNHDRTYTGWISVDGNVEIGCFDHDTHEVQTTVLHENHERDDHDAPTFYVDSDDCILVFYSEHAGPEICFRRSDQPEDLFPLDQNAGSLRAMFTPIRIRAASAASFTCFTETRREASHTSFPKTTADRGATNGS